MCVEFGTQILYIYIRFFCLSYNITIVQIGHQQTTAMSRQVVGRDPPRVLLVDDSRNDLRAAARVLKSFDIRGKLDVYAWLLKHCAVRQSGGSHHGLTLPSRPMGRGGVEATFTPERD